METAIAAYLVFRVASAWGFTTLVTRYANMTECTGALRESKMTGPPNASTSHAIAFCSNDQTYERWLQR